jgi:hypothetical protein
MKVIIDGIEYVPKLEVKPIPDDKFKKALNELVNIQYFRECENKHRAWAWDALNHLCPELAELASKNPQAAYRALNPEE